MKITTKQIAYSAILLALGLITSAIKLFHLPFGGSITLFSMFFICYIGFLFGAKISLISAVAYGILQFLFNPSFYSIYQFFTDYVLAFGCLGLSGLFYQRKYSLHIGYIVSIIGRFVFASLSGFIFFSQYAPENMHPIIYSVAYNGTYIFTEGILTIVIISIPYINKQLYKFRDRM